MSASSPQRRDLDFRSFAAVFEEIDRLRRLGYRRLGDWDLVQILRHLAIAIRWSLDGFPTWLPWPVQPLARFFVLRPTLRKKRFPANRKAAVACVFEPGADASEALREFESAVQRLEAEAGPMAKSPLFGAMTRSQWRELHLIHCGHHLGFLKPMGL